MNHSPHHYEVLAEAAETRGDWQYAIAAWNSASAVSLGHNRAARYQDRAEWLAREHGVPRAFVYVDDIQRGKDHIGYNLMIMAEQIEWDERLRYIVQGMEQGLRIVEIVETGIYEGLEAGEVDEVLPHHYLGTPNQAEGG